jgi:hypothetical protein
VAFAQRPQQTVELEAIFLLVMYNNARME